MNSKEALIYIEENYKKIPSFLADKKMGEFKEKVVEVLKKDVPAEPEYVEESNKDFFDDGYKCPCCNEKISDGDIWDTFMNVPNVPEYCPKCGQKLNWEKYLSK